MTDALAPLPVAIPLLCAAVIMAVHKQMPRWLADALAVAASLAVLGACVLLGLAARARPIEYWFGGWAPVHGAAIGIAFSIDPTAALVAGFIALLFALTFLYSWWYFEGVGHVYHVIMLCFLGAMCGFALSGDIFNMFVFFELMSAAAFGLCGYKIEEDVALAGTINFAVTNTAGAFFFLIGIALVYGKTGALNLAQIGASLAHQPPDGAIVAAFVLIFLGLGVKAAIVPLHLWLDDAHAVAPTPLCVLFSGIMVQLGLFGMARIYWSAFALALAPHGAAIRGTFMAAGVATILTGGAMAFLQSHLKRLLAFSTVSHSGILLCALGSFTPLGLRAMVAYIVAHGLVKASLFMGTGIMLQKHGTVDEQKLAGRGQGAIWGASLFLAGGFALAGLPPFGNFAAKALLERASDPLGFGWIVAALILGSALDGGAAIRAGLRIYTGLGGRGDDSMKTHHEARAEQSESLQKPRDIPRTMLVPSSLCLLLCLLWGLVVGLPRDPIVYLTETITLALAVGLALAALLPGAFRRRRERFFRALRRPIRMLRGLHSGKFPDYVAWMVAGGAAFAVLVFATTR